MSISADVLFEQAVELYCNRTAAAHTQAMLKTIYDGGNPSDTLYSLLKQWKPIPVSQAGRDVTLRPFDELLDFYSIIEIGCLLRIFPSPLPVWFVVIASDCLGDNHLLNYCRHVSGRLLPVRLKDRLRAGNAIDTAVPDNAMLLFSRFLDLHSTIYGDPDIESFLGMLSVGDEEGSSWSVITKSWRTPEAFVMALDENRGLCPILYGFRKYVDFCFSLDRLLATIDEDYLEVSAAFLEFYTPQLESVGEALRSLVRNVSNSMLQWNILEKTPDDKTNSTDRMRTAYDDLNAMISRLVERIARVATVNEPVPA